MPTIAKIILFIAWKVKILKVQRERERDFFFISYEYKHERERELKCYRSKG
jgi:hypothetical protein